MLRGYAAFRKKYVNCDNSVLKHLASRGQKPEVMIVSCCDSRVDPALILQCEPGELFVVRNVANIVPPFEKDEKHHGTSAALEFGIRFLKVKHLVILGHSQCGGIQELVGKNTTSNDFISNWVSIVDRQQFDREDPDHCAQLALRQSYKNCLTFPWIQKRLEAQELRIHLWFFDIQTGTTLGYCEKTQTYKPILSEAS